MHTDALDTDEDFFHALALLHSTEEDSAEKLCQILNTRIETKYGPGRTLASRMPKRSLENDSNPSMRTLKRRDHAQGCNATNNKTIRDVSEVISLLGADIAEGNASHRTIDVKVFKLDYKDCCDDEDVPRISIPDEGPADGTVCKICNGARLGALILLECQECQEAYHPLCHQPPVIDIDVYDPRFVWRCKRCVEASSSVISTGREITERGPSETVRRHSETAKENANISGSKILEKKNGDLPLDSPIESRSAQLRDSLLFAKDLAILSQRNGGLSSSTQSRKRIGSKLSITRTSVK